VRVIKHAQLPGHLLLGAGAAQMAIDYSGRQPDEAAVWQEVSASADFDAQYTVELPAPRETTRGSGDASTRGTGLSITGLGSST
jgi:hypothetical protein